MTFSIEGKKKGCHLFVLLFHQVVDSHRRKLDHQPRPWGSHRNTHPLTYTFRLPLLSPTYTLTHSVSTPSIHTMWPFPGQSSGGRSDDSPAKFRIGGGVRGIGTWETAGGYPSITKCVSTTATTATGLGITHTRTRTHTHTLTHTHTHVCSLSLSDTIFPLPASLSPWHLFLQPLHLSVLFLPLSSPVSLSFIHILSPLSFSHSLAHSLPRRFILSFWSSLWSRFPNAQHNPSMLFRCLIKTHFSFPRSWWTCDSPLHLSSLRADCISSP